MQTFKNAIFSIFQDKDKVCLSLICATVFFLSHPFTGITGDGEIYLLHVLQSRAPDRYINDLEFIGGNQSSFSLFNYLYGAFIRTAGAFYGTALLTYLMAALWGIACALFIQRIDGEKAPLLFLCASVFCIHYGPTNWIYYGEMICTPRILAEALSLLGCYFVFKKMKTHALLAFIAGTLMHPLMAGWFLPIWFFLYYPKTQIPILMVSALFPLSAFFNIGPFRQFDPIWNGAAQEFKQWTPLKIGRIISYIALLWSIPFLFFGKKERSFWNKTVIVAIIAGYWTFTSIALKHIFLTQVQPWRIEWFIALTALIFSGYFILHFRALKFKQPDKKRSLILCILSFAAITYILYSNLYNEYQWLHYNGGWASILYASPRVPLFLSAFIFCAILIYSRRRKYISYIYILFLLMIAAYLTYQEHTEETLPNKQLDFFLEHKDAPFERHIQKDYAEVFYMFPDMQERTYWNTGAYSGSHAFWVISRDRYMASRHRVYEILKHKEILQKPFTYPYYWPFVQNIYSSRDSLEALGVRLLDAHEIKWVVYDKAFFDYPKVDSLYLEAFHKRVYLYKARAI